ncbi:MAG: FtsX-like permease family protein [Rhodocyclaceae bacterium]|uniref:ABC transporter permease n=1 Tax=Candidatus Desulfobacillus denitrificans TaxID=2608985 RepID=A0A809SA95_9PROT|nr:FtsX-like permease family protein [Rhodocyclaceae bacterium]OQY72372.1 MAG: ABC transporter permease [Rhodocyclaceae bacterium UTPRO2]BBO20764.1 ABC transporter permease [Candidatus Desulfobacillus denitrificans]GJQ55300.1 MAG: inner membrane transport permease [Rhodocyclaceae bacterium]
MNGWHLAWQMLRRDFRAGELRLLGLALVIAVASLSSVSFFSDRLSRALAREAHQLLGGDLLLLADHAWDESYRAEAERLGLRVIGSASFPSMTAANGASHLADIKAVEPGYPLRGSLRIAPALNRPDAETQETPARGEVWLDERLAAALEAKVGDVVQLGNARLAVSAVLTLEPDRGVNFFNIAPRLLMQAADLPATQLIQVGSRVTYRLHLAGEAKAVAAYQKWAERQLGRGERIESLDNARPEVRNALDRAEKFLRLAALLAAVLAAVAVGLGARRFMQRHLDGCAVMRCLGARESQLLRIYLGEFLLFGAIASALGCLAGFGAQYALERLLANLLTAALPAPSPLPLVHGFALGLALLAGFALPQLMRLRNVPTVRVLRREWADAEPLAWTGYAFGAAVLAGLMLWMAADLKLGVWVLGLFSLAVALYAGVARLALAAAGRLRGAAGAGWRYGIASLARRLGTSLIQAVALGLGMTALLLLTLARDDLLASWKRSMPPDAPNRFVINIQPEQREPVRALFAAKGLDRPTLLPMIRGRLVAVNGRPVVAADYAEERAQRLVEREFNLSWMAELPEGNSLTAGRWFAAQDAGTPQFSVEQGLADTLKLKLHDVLTYEIAGRRLEAEITSLRKLDWDSMRVNFFVVTPPGVLEPFPTSYITSFHLPQEKAGFVGELVAAHPNLTVIDVASILRQLQSVMDQLARAVQFVFAFSLVAGLAVLFAALESTHDEREYEIAVLRTLGARNRQLRAALAAEFAALGAIAGVVAGVGSAAISWLLGRFVFQIPYEPAWLVLPAGVIMGVLGITLAGLAGTARTLRAPALQSLRALA